MALVLVGSLQDEHSQHYSYILVIPFLCLYLLYHSSNGDLCQGGMEPIRWFDPDGNRRGGINGREGANQ